ncbi:GNAT family N-acetyltransferase [Massilia endophytica]|uniref:GNAT family N-acetyltransferase n=1 Tax=Massilia endophytica TaxID=2899220 RepID=UPI001E53DC10|nr:GNAT family N-acetyltransferase [Massilia endophytica]UGQ45487.1 GNAT family N-acetyltransferase [Massilia endophytica]
MKIDLSALDQQRFGIVTAKANLEAEDSAAAVKAWCAQNGVRMLIARCSTSHLALVQQLEQAGAFLTDTLVYYRRREIAAQQVALPPGYRWRLAQPGDAEAVEILAGRTFEGYFGHYHSDPKLNRADADAVYAQWAGNSCRSTAVASAVLLIEHDSGIVAFATLKDLGQQEFEGVLFGVHPEHQGQRLYHALMQLAQNWAAERDFRSMVVSTQINNLSVQKVWCRQGFEPSSSYYTFHQWF